MTDSRDEIRARFAAILRRGWFWRAAFLLWGLGPVGVVALMAILSHKPAIYVALAWVLVVYAIGFSSAAVTTWREWRLVRWLEEKP